MTLSFQENQLAAWSLLFSQRQDFLNSPLMRVPITRNHEGTNDMGDKVLSSRCAQHMDSSGYQVSDLEDVEL